ncbi:MAG: MarR family winged helix-turn-helix transcriptional regulator [Lachnospiraceae bacterium]|nr:MarR family winged helix-turn-helix transcriptional regulator [Lachnospiraceae bacterium]
MEDNYPLIEETIGHLRFFGHFLHYQMGNKFGRRRILKIMLEHKEAARVEEPARAGMCDASENCGTASSEGILQRELQDILHIQSGSLSEIIIKIEAEGLIEKTRSEKDGRQIVLRLTPEGERLARTYKAEHEEKLRHLTSCLSDEEMKDLNKTLSRLEEHWKELGDTAFKNGGTAENDEDC